VQVVNRAPQAALATEAQVVSFPDVDIVDKPESLLPKLFRIGNDDAPFPVRPEPVFELIAQLASPDIPKRFKIPPRSPL
jgi:hypothetical protein